MSLTALYDDRIEAGFQRDFKAPPRPVETSFSTWSFLSAGAKGIPRGGLEMGASGAEGIDEAIGPVGDERNRNPAGALFSNFLQNMGPSIRQEAHSFAPPETAHAADQVIHGLTRIGSKAVVATVAAGGDPVVAGTLLAAEETNTVYRELIAKGIDRETALKVAGIQGITTGASIAAPMVGPTIKATLGLVAATGPGAYMAQEAMARKVLEKAGYHDEAMLHDPTDPLGLTIATLLPAAVGGVHIARLRPPALADVVRSLESKGQRFNPDGSELQGPVTKYGTAKGDMQVLDSTALQPGHGIAPAKTLADGSIDPADRARVGVELIGKLQDKYGSPDKAMAAYNWGEGNLDKAIAKYGEDWREHAPAETKAYVAHGLNKLRSEVATHAASDPAVVEAARVRVTNDALYRSMPDHPEAVGEVMRAADDVAAGRAPDVQPLEGVLTNKRGVSFYDTRGDTDRFHGTGRQIDSLSDDYALSGDNRNIYGQGFYTTDAADIAAGYMRKGGKEGALYRVSHDDVSLYDMEAAVPSDVHAAVAKAMGDVPTHNAVTGAPLKNLREIYDEYRAESKNEGLSRDDVQEVFDSIRDNLEQMGYRGFSHVGGHNTGNLAHSVKIFWNPEQHVRLSSADLKDYQPLGSSPRSEGTNTLPPPERVALEAEKPAKAAEPVQSPDAVRVAKMAEETPDLKVTLPGHEQPMTLATALERAKAEAAEEVKQADLVQAALDCALSMGSA